MSGQFFYSAARQKRRRIAKFVNACEVRLMAALAGPIAGIALVNVSMAVTDTIMASVLGPTALAAIAVGSDVYSIFFFALASAIGGLSPLLAQAVATADRQRMDKIRAASWVVYVLGLSIVFPIVWFSPLALSFAGVEDDLLNVGEGYVRLMALTMIPLGIVAVYRARFAAIQRPQVALYISLCAIPLNALANFVFMFGVGDWNGLGVIGAGYASLVVSATIATAMAIAAKRIGDRAERFKPQICHVVELLRAGVPIGLATLAEVGVFFGATIYLAATSADQVAAHAIVLRLASIAYVVPYGLLQAGMVRMARTNSGRHARLRRKRAIVSGGILSLTSGAVLGTSLVGVAFFLPGLLSSAGTINPSQMHLITSLILIVALMEFAEPVGTAFTGLMRGQRDDFAAMAVSVVGSWGVAMPIALGLDYCLASGVIGIWLGLAAGKVVAAFISARRVLLRWG
ncbi:MAG: MATE family efflux transporter [Rhizobiaceae bacterium]